MNESEGDYFLRFRGSPGMVDRINISVSGTINKTKEKTKSTKAKKKNPLVMKPGGK